METYNVTESALINAPAEKVYAILADYRNGHPHILPRPPFVSLEVEEGGIGAGTRFRMQMRAFGKTQTAQAVVTEPEPGRVLVETIPEAGIVTTFVVMPAGNGQQARTTFSTDLKAPRGLLAPLERWMTRRFLEQTYRRELQLLDAFAQAQSQNTPAIIHP
ncbi:MAG: SRPBCC family protein [Anaerolineae bacterium]|nr:SRPBCC family protein [Anaerolineae bacterium]